VAAVRFSLADPRLRHQGVSHHTRTALRLATHSRVDVAVPRGPYEARVRADLDADGLADRHRLVAVDVPDVAALLEAAGLRVTSMGRGAENDPGFFAAAGAAGVVAAQAGPPDDSQ
jgi:hypothetical protein